MTQWPAALAILVVLVGVLAGCDSTIPRDIEPSLTPRVAGVPRTFSSHGISFEYPGDWSVIPVNAPTSPDPLGTLSSHAVGLDRLDLVLVSVFGAKIRVTAENFSAHLTELEIASESLLEAMGYGVQGKPESISVNGLPGLRWQITLPTSVGYVLEGTGSILFDVTTLYVIQCPSVPERAGVIDQGCDQILESFALQPVGETLPTSTVRPR